MLLAQDQAERITRSTTGFSRSLGKFSQENYPHLGRNKYRSRVEERRHSRELLAESTLGTSFPVRKRIGQVKAALLCNRDYRTELSIYRGAYNGRTARACRLEYPFVISGASTESFLVDKVCEGREVAETSHLTKSKLLKR